MAAARRNKMPHIRRVAPHSVDTETSLHHTVPVLVVERKCLLVVWAVKSV